MTDVTKIRTLGFTLILFCTVLFGCSFLSTIPLPPVGPLPSPTGGPMAPPSPTPQPTPIVSPMPAPSATPTPQSTPQPACSFPPGVPDEDYTPVEVPFSKWQKTVNDTIKELTGCPEGSDCPYEEYTCNPDVFSKVNAALQKKGLCAGLHYPGVDEIAVSDYCTGVWEGFHICNYGGVKVVWRSFEGAVKIDPRHCK